MRIAFAASAVRRRSRPARCACRIYEDGVHQATVARADNNAFVRGDEPSLDCRSLRRCRAGGRRRGGPPTLYDAVYETALEQQVPKPLIDQLVRIFAFDVDFQPRVAPGDSLEVFHSMADPADKDAGDPEILYASLTPRSTVTSVSTASARPTTASSTTTTRTGRARRSSSSASRCPSARLTSGFGYRRHPILGRMILHAGVDYAAPRGTPILAAGNGIVEKAGRSSGYGNLIVIKHTNGYETAYGHQSRFAKGIAPGVARPSGPGDRLCRLDRPVDRPARPLRDPRQRPAGRPAAHPPAARPRAPGRTISPPSSASASASTRCSTHARAGRTREGRRESQQRPPLRGERPRIASAQGSPAP